LIVNSSDPDYSNSRIPNFKHSRPFEHQFEFYQNRDRDILMKSPTCSGKTDAFLISFINEFLEQRNNNKRVRCLYLAPTRLLMHSQFENLRNTLDEHKIRSVILEGGLSFAELFKKLLENDFIISSPDIIFYLLLRKRKTQHIELQYSEFIKHLYSIVFDEIHLFETYTLVNIKNLIKIMKNIKDSLRVHILSATVELSDILEMDDFLIIDGKSKTSKVFVRADGLNYLDIENVKKFLEDNDYTKETIYVCNSVDRAIKLNKYFEDSAILIGKMWYENSSGLSRDELIKDNLKKCKEGKLTFTTSVFRQGVDISLKRLITEEPLCSQDAIQTFGRCGRHDESEFIMLTSKSPIIRRFNSDETVEREEFEKILAGFFIPAQYGEQKRMMKAMWYKLYTKTRLKDFVEFLITEDMKDSFTEFRDFLPDVSFRDPLPAVEYDDLMVGLFDVLKYKDAYRYLSPGGNSISVGVLKDGGRLRRREYGRARKEDLPIFTLVSEKRYRDTEYWNLELKLRDLGFRVNAKVGPLGKYHYSFVKSKKLLPVRKSFEPIVFFG